MRAVVGISLILSSSALFFSPNFLYADLNPESCNQLFGLPKGTIENATDKKVMNEEVCGAYAFLMTRYTAGSCSSRVPNAKTNGITSLNPDFAVALAKMLKAAPASIISAYRNADAQRCANPSSPNSNHTFGCAVDLGYDQNSCSSALCQWVLKNAPSYGLQIRMKFAPEWNHIEPMNVQQCRSRGPGGGVIPGEAGVSAAPSGGVSDWLRQQVAPESQQMCALPGGGSAPCNAIKNSAVPSGQAGSGGSSGGASSGSSVSSSGSSAPQVCAPQFFCSGTELRYRASSCTEQTYQVCPNGCTGSACNPPSAATGVLDSVLSSTSSNAQTNTEKEKIPVFDQLMGLLDTEPKKNEPVATGSPLLLISGDDVQHLRQPTSTEQLWQPTVYSPTPNPVSQTFTSDDLRWNAAPQPTVQANSGIQSVLANFRTMLLNVLDRLRPFNGKLPGDEFGERY